MLLLVLGGTRFLSRETATQAVARGWDVTCACRGESGPVPDGATHLPWDRADDPPAALVDGGWDAVVDVTRLPSHARSARRGRSGRALGVRLDDQRLHRQLLAGDGAAGRADHRGRRPRRGPGGLRRHEGRLRTGRAGARRVVRRRAPRPHRRPRRPDRTVRLLAAAAGARRRGAGTRHARRRGPGDRRTRPGDLAARPRRGAHDRRLRRGRPTDAVRRLLAGVAAGVGSRARAHVGRPGLPRGARGRAVGRRRLAAAVAAAPGVRRHAGARPRTGRGGRAAAPPSRRDRARLPRLPGHRAGRERARLDAR